MHFSLSKWMLPLALGTSLAGVSSLAISYGLAMDPPGSSEPIEPEDSMDVDDDNAHHGDVEDPAGEIEQSALEGENAISDDPRQDRVEDESSGSDEADHEPDQNDRYEARTEELIERIHTAKENGNTTELENLRGELKQVVTEHFEWIESKRREQVESLEKRLIALKQLLKTRKDRETEIIERRLKNLLNESDALDWNPAVNAASLQTSPSSERYGEAMRALDQSRKLEQKQLKANGNLEAGLSKLSEQDRASPLRDQLRENLNDSRLAAEKARLDQSFAKHQADLNDYLQAQSNRMANINKALQDVTEVYVQRHAEYVRSWDALAPEARASYRAKLQELQNQMEILEEERLRIKAEQSKLDEAQKVLDVNRADVLKTLAPLPNLPVIETDKTNSPEKSANKN